MVTLVRIGTSTDSLEVEFDKEFDKISFTDIKEALQKDPKYTGGKIMGWFKVKEKVPVKRIKKVNKNTTEASIKTEASIFVNKLMLFPTNEKQLEEILTEFTQDIIKKYKLK